MIEILLPNGLSVLSRLEETSKEIIIEDFPSQFDFGLDVLRFAGVDESFISEALRDGINITFYEDDDFQLDLPSMIGPYLADGCVAIFSEFSSGNDSGFTSIRLVNNLGEEESFDSFEFTKKAIGSLTNSNVDRTQDPIDITGLRI